MIEKLFFDELSELLHVIITVAIGAVIRVVEWKEHVSGRSSYLRRFRPIEVIHQEWFNSRKEARIKEVYIKNMGARLYLLNIKYKR